MIANSIWDVSLTNLEVVSIHDTIPSVVNDPVFSFSRSSMLTSLYISVVVDVSVETV